MIRLRRIGFLLATVAPFLVNGAEGLSEEDKNFFEQKVLPIFEQNCFECHSHQSGKMKNGLTLDSRSGWAEGGEHGPAIIPGKPEESLLIKAVRRADPDLKMPPKKELRAADVEALVEWVKRGAPDPRETKGARTREGKEWWSLKPLTQPEVPAGFGHPIDAFISSRLAKEGIAPAPEADRRTLIRRLTFDLHGLPPTVEEADCFLGDADSRSYEKLVDRLLASPRYGERWARHWLDTIHFADTHGFEHDLMRTNAWRYRDYVIEALNRDTPWDRFIREQLAPDVFFPDEPTLMVGLGFVGAGPWDHSTAQTAPKTFDYIDRDDIVTQTMSTFASATVHCARCHDHKFDPISQEDYYALQAVFAGIGKGDIAFDEDVQVHQERRRWKQLLAAVARNDSTVLLAPANEKLVAQWEEAVSGEVPWEVIQPATFVTTSSAALKRGDDGSLISEGTRPETDTYTITAQPKLNAVTAIRLEVLSDSALPKKGPGRNDNGNFHLSEFEARAFQPGATEGKKLAFRRATADFNQTDWTISAAIDGKEKTAWGIFPQVGESHTAVFELKEKLALTNGAHLVFQIKQLHGTGHVIGKFRLAVTDDDPARTVVIPATVAEVRRIPREQRSETQQVTLAAWALKTVGEAAIEALPPPLHFFGAGPEFFAVVEGFSYKPWAEAKAVHRLSRGDINQPRESAIPGALSGITNLSARFESKDPADESARRARLADWLADDQNPLTWRSIVNRVWQYHFGRGLSDTPNDFGRMGSVPTHTELLDWLAVDFRDHDGSLKRLHRLILTSAAYRRAARHDEAAHARDPDALLLWRRQKQQMDAETFRDSVLALSGRLDLKTGGPGVHHFKLGKPIQLTPTVDYGPFDWDSPGAGRRSIYRFVYRGLPDPFLDALNFPDAAQLTPARSFSASALQSLALLNDDFVLRHSQWFEERLKTLGGTTEEQARAGFRLAFQRDPVESERADFAAYAKEHGLDAMCRLLFNSNEFLFID